MNESVIQIVLYRLIQSFVKPLTIIFVLTECLAVFQSENILNNTLSPYEQSFPVLKFANVQKENLLREGQISLIKDNDEDKDGKNGKNEKNEKNEENEKKSRICRHGPKIWDQWGNWSSCSVTCGIGKLTRWRHCISGSCLLGEKRAQLKTCTLATC